MSRKIVDEHEYNHIVSQYNKDLVKDFLIEKKVTKEISWYD